MFQDFLYESLIFIDIAYALSYIINEELILMKTANYNIRLDPAIKAKAEETYAEFGLNLSEAINVFLHMSIKQSGFPFEVRNPKLNAETLLAIQETEQIINEYNNSFRTQKTFSNAREMFASMDAEDEAEKNDE
jgi:DNA-damage-inducible protein J